MKATITNFGDRIGVQFPQSLLKRVEISENDDVEILVKDKRIIIQRPDNPKRLTTKERIAAFSGEPDNQLSEFEWGKPQGKEVW